MAFRTYNRERHTLRRAAQRYNIDLSPAQLVKVARAIIEHRAEQLSPTVYRVNLHEIDDRLPDRSAIFAFSHARGEVRTMLPHDWTPESAALYHAEHLPPPAKGKPSAYVPADPDFNTMTLDDAKAWRLRLIHLLAGAILKADRNKLQRMIATTNKAIKRLGILQKHEDGKAAKLAKAIERNGKNARMSEIANELWASAGIIRH